LKRASTPSDLFELVGEQSISGPAGCDPPPRPERAAYRPQTAAPDPGLELGWAETLRHAIADPDWPRRQAQKLLLLEAYDASVEANQQRLFALPDPPEAEESDIVITSATGLVTYATCPKRYHWTSVDPLPRRASDAARRGTEIHRRIELHNLGIVPLDEVSDTTYDLTFDGDDTPGGDPYTVFERSRYAEVKPLLTEVPFDLRAGTGRVRGRIDAVYPLGDDGWEIVDFKSGRDREDGANLVQLQTYALAIADIDFGLSPPSRSEASFVYLGGEALEVRSHVIDDAWMERAATTVDGLLEAIGRGEWQATPSDACVGCDFLRFCAIGRHYLESR
jgi:RecB family exonuclease